MTLKGIRDRNKKRKEIYDRATPSPWDAVWDDGDYDDKWYDIWSPGLGSVAHLSESARSYGNMKRIHADAKFISYARSDTVVEEIEWLLDTIDQLKAILEK